MIAFLVFLLVGLCFMLFGIYLICSKKATPSGFWANVKASPVTDVKAYNRAMGKLWCVYGAVFAFLGIPMLGGQNSPYPILSIFGIFMETIAVMAVYTLKIEKKYKQSDSSVVKK